MMLWAWESAAPLAGGRGLADDQGRAQQAAAKWMVDHGADRAVLKEVQLVCEDAINPLYLPVGACRSYEASRDARGGVRWRAPAHGAEAGVVTGENTDAETGA